MTERLGSIDVFPPASQYVYMDAASVGLSHAHGAQAISDWQRDLAERGTVAFTEQDEVACLNNLNDATARQFRADAGDIATASSGTVLMASLAWAVMPGTGSNIVATETTHPSTVYPWMRVAEHTGAEMRWARGRCAGDRSRPARRDDRRQHVDHVPVPCRVGHRAGVRPRAICRRGPSS